MGFFNIYSVAKPKNEGGPLGNLFQKKSQCRKKTEMRDPLVSPSMVLRGKRQKTFRFSSLDQMIQFGTIKFCRTHKNYFGQFVWIEKIIKKVTIIVAVRFMKRRLKRVTKIVVFHFDQSLNRPSGQPGCNKS